MPMETFQVPFVNSSEGWSGDAPKFGGNLGAVGVTRTKLAVIALFSRDGPGFAITGGRQRPR
jgi:hypothetical protein